MALFFFNANRPRRVKQLMAIMNDDLCDFFCLQVTKWNPDTVVGVKNIWQGLILASYGPLGFSTVVFLLMENSFDPYNWIHIGTNGRYVVMKSRAQRRRTKSTFWPQLIFSH